MVTKVYRHPDIGVALSWLEQGYDGRPLTRVYTVVSEGSAPDITTLSGDTPEGRDEEIAVLKSRGWTEHEVTTP